MSSQALNRAHTYHATKAKAKGLIYKNTIGVVSIILSIRSIYSPMD